MRIIGLDPSLSSTGVAILGHGNELLALKSLKTSAPDNATNLDVRAQRITSLANRLDDVLDETLIAAGGDPRVLLVVETRDFQTDAPGHATDRAGLLLQLVITCRSYGAVTVGISPATLKVFATGRGGHDVSKRDVMSAIESRYGVPVANSDEADAFTLAAMGAYAAGRPLLDTIPATHTRAIRSVDWPKFATTREVRP